MGKSSSENIARDRRRSKLSVGIKRTAGAKRGRAGFAKERIGTTASETMGIYLHTIVGTPGAFLGKLVNYEDPFLTIPSPPPELSRV